MDTSASGFLFGENKGALASLVAFTATTPSTAQVTQQNPNGGGLVFQIQGDSITSLRYSNTIFSGVTTLIPGMASSAKSVLISFDPTTGQLESVLPVSKVSSSLGAKKARWFMTAMC